MGFCADAGVEVGLGVFLSHVVVVFHHVFITHIMTASNQHTHCSVVVLLPTPQ